MMSLAKMFRFKMRGKQVCDNLHRFPSCVTISTKDMRTEKAEKGGGDVI